MSKAEKPSLIQVLLEREQEYNISHQAHPKRIKYIKKLWNFHHKCKQRITTTFLAIALFDRCHTLLKRPNYDQMTMAVNYIAAAYEESTFPDLNMYIPEYNESHLNILLSEVAEIMQLMNWQTAPVTICNFLQALNAIEPAIKIAMTVTKNARILDFPPSVVAESALIEAHYRGYEVEYTQPYSPDKNIRLCLARLWNRSLIGLLQNRQITLRPFSNFTLLNRHYDSYQLLDKLGDGVFGNVYSSKCGYAVKVIKCQELLLYSILREINALQSLSHPNIVKVQDICYNTEKAEMYLVLERMDGNMRTYLEKTKNELIPVKLFMHQLLSGLAHIHNKGFIHRDIKVENILITDTTIKIADFGLSRWFMTEGQVYTRKVQTPEFRAPEILRGTNHYDSSIDIWSIGMIMMEFIRGSLYSEITGDESQASFIEDMVDKVGIASLARDLNDSNGIDLLTRLLKINPKERITAQEALEHPYFSI